MERFQYFEARVSDEKTKRRIIIKKKKLDSTDFSSNNFLRVCVSRCFSTYRRERKREKTKETLADRIDNRVPDFVGMSESDDSLLGNERLLRMFNFIDVVL